MSTELRDLPALAVGSLIRPVNGTLGRLWHRVLSKWLDRWKGASKQEAEPQPACISLPVKAALYFSGAPVARVIHLGVVG